MSKSPLLTLILILSVGFGAPLILEVNSARAQAPTNPGYRVQIYVNSNSGNVNLPSSSQSWQIEYKYLVPPLPSSSTWDYTSQTIYQWGDVDFDSYGSGGTYPLSSYVYNQIVPQLFIGRVLSGNDAYYNATWSDLSSWAIQAQYYWQEGSTPYAQTGSIVNVSPGDQITTLLSYNPGSGAISVSISDDDISGPSGTSSITLYKPFPNDPSLFTSWTDFFNKGEALSGDSYIISHPVLNVETGYVDEQTLCPLLPFTVNQISIPGIPSMPSEFATQPVGGLTCSQQLSTLNF